MLGAAGADEITALSAEALSAAIHAGRLSCRELMQATLARIARLNPVHKAIVSLRDGDALVAEADACDAQLRAGRSTGWLHGVPQAIKDMAATRGLPTTFGSPLFADHRPAEDGLMVQRIKAAGAIVIGKSNTPEFGLGSHTFNEVFGLTRNAFDPSRSAGGSSGGAAVALATRMLAVADGSDFMGSLRNPAAWNNVFGLRPSQGRVPAWPAADVWIAQLGTEGPMARTVRDLALLLQTQAGYDPRAPLSLDEGGSFIAGIEDFEPGSVRIGWLGDLDGHLPFEPGILELCEQGLLRLEREGRCAIERPEPGFAPEAVWQAWRVWRHALVSTRIAPLLQADPAHRARIKPEALWEHEEAQRLGAADLLAASAQRSSFHRQMLALLEHCEVLALPSAQCWPFEATLRWPAQIAGRQMDSYHRWMEVVIYATFAGLPAINVPVGFGPGGLPMGMQLIGHPRGEAALLRLARAYERMVPDILAIRPAEPAPSAG